MKIVKFINETWQEIPNSCNPAMQNMMYADGRRRSEELIMIFKGTHQGITDGGFVVSFVPLRGDITKLGVFWRLENAELFANAYSMHKED